MAALRSRSNPPAPAFVGRCPFVAPARCQSGESLAGGLKDRFASRLGLIAPDNHVDIERINLDAAAPPPRPFGGDERRSRPKEGIDHDIAGAVTSRSPSTSKAVGFTVGWSRRPLRASDPIEEAPG